MADIPEILSTKLALPRLQANLVPRTALVARLNQGLEHKLTLLSAPAGFGKTSLALAWLASLETSPARPAVAWLSLDEGDNDPIRFWRYVISACREFQRDKGEAALSLLRSLPQFSFEAVLTKFINELAQFPGKYILVLEDYHVITSKPIHLSITFLLDHLPPTLHLVLITRYDPPLSMARLRVRNELNELHAADLRFSASETEAFLRQAAPLPLSAEAIARLEARTEGWVAGLRLVTLALQQRQEVEPFLYTFTGSHGHILEYLVDEVLKAQPEPIQAFLLRTSFLSRLTAPLCDAVTGRTDSALVLEQLERAHLFLTPLDGARRWYRYHALFAEAMQHYARLYLGETELLDLYKKASTWYEEHEFLAEAVETALSARAFPRSANLIERVIETQSFYKELNTLQRWIERLPEEVYRIHPMLCFTQAMTILFTADRRAPETAALLEQPLQMAETAWQAEDNQPKLGEVLALRALVAWWQGDLERSFAAARQSLELLPEAETGWRGSSLLNLGMAETLAGRLKPARQLIGEALTLCEASGNIHGALAARYVLAEILAGQGALHRAAQMLEQLLSEARLIEIGEARDDQGHALLSLARLAYEWNDLETAHQNAAQALDFGREIGAEELIAPATLILARLKQITGEPEQAQQLLHSLIAQLKQPHLLREVQAGQAWLWLRAGNLAGVQRWSTTFAQAGPAFLYTQQEREALIVARLLLAQGEADAALRLLNPWQEDAAAQGRTRSELEIMLLKALAFFTRNDLTQAGQTLSQVLTLAQPEGYRRLFLDEGEKMAALLKAALPEIREEPLVTYTHTLLAHFASPKAAPPIIQNPKSTIAQRSREIQNLLEPLSPQEQRVLRLLAAGLSNPEIAEELVVSINTVKTQVKSIYRKLEAHSRDEAADIARRLNLL